MKNLIQLVFFSMILFGCENSLEKKSVVNALKRAVKAKAIVVPEEKLKPPKVTLLSSMPEPQKIEVPKKTGGSYFIKKDRNQIKVDLVPPEIKPAGMFYVMQRYTTHEGLSINSVISGLTDKAGNLWVGTQGGGVSKYDGKSFKTYSVAQGIPSVVPAIMEDKSGNIWFASNDGGIRYDGASFKTYSKAQGLASGLVVSMFEDKAGNIWFATDKGASKYDGTSFKTYSKAQGLASDSVASILEDRAGNIWFATDRGASKFDGASFKTYSKAQGLASDSVASILEDRAGNIWFATDRGASKFDGASFKTYSKTEGLASDSVASILEDTAGNMWFATDGGVSKFDGTSFTSSIKDQGFPKTRVQFIVKDKTGNLWFGCPGFGLYKYDGTSFANFPTPFYAKKIIKDKTGNIWFATLGGGVNKYVDNSFINYSTKQGLPSDSVSSILEDRAGNLWFATDRGVSKYDGKYFTNYTPEQGLASYDVLSILEDKTGNLWFTTYYGGGVSKFDGTSITNYSTEQGLPSNDVTTILEDKTGNIWFGTWDGASKYDGTGFKNYYPLPAGLASDISSILEDQTGMLWFTTPHGVSRFDSKTVLNYGIEHGLPDSFVLWARIAQEGNIAFGTNHGVAYLTGYVRESPGNTIKIPAQNNLTNEELENYTPIFEIFNISTGYPVADADSGSFYFDGKDAAWFGTGDAETGLVRFDYSALHKGKTPQVFIDGVKIDNKRVVWNDLLERNEGPATPPQKNEEGAAFGRLLSGKERNAMWQEFGDIIFDSISKWYSVPQNLELPHSHNSIIIDFVAIEIDKPQNVFYQHILEGYDKDWSSPSNKSQAEFANLFEGSYHFKVRAKNQFNDWSEPTSYPFKVLPPWYRTWWAYSLYAITTLLSLFLIYRWRTASLRAHQASMERFMPLAFLHILKKKRVEDVNLGDSAKVEMAVMFSDIRGFTTLTEKLGPENTALVLNKYMGYMAPIIRKYDGVVGQFLGDGILAFFDIKPEKAIEAVFEMQKALPAFNKDLQAYGIDAVDIGIGLNLGPAMFSMIGEAQRLEGHVISDDVNLAARLESLNKTYLTNFLITGAVYDRIADPNKYLACLVDKVIVKGKTHPVRIYEIWPLPEGEALEVGRRFVAFFEKAFAAYEKGDFVKAEETFKECLTQWPVDTVVDMFIKRCVELQKTGAPEGWDGTTKLTEK